MKRMSTFVFAILLTTVSFAQVGIGTTSPNTTLDVRGSLAVNSRSFSTTSESVLSTDYTLLFTGNSACTLTLPSAAGCVGRILHIKNTKTGTVPVLTIATTASQTIDGASTWLLNEASESVNIVSDGSNWRVMGTSLPASNAWLLGGNTVGAVKEIGTIDNYDLPFITNNTEKMRITSTGRVAIGTSTFDATNPEKLLVDAGNTSSFNVISGKGTIDNYLQLNIQNKSATGNASSDLVATADNGNESVNYVDLGINSSAYTNVSSPIIGGINNAYLYSTGNDFIIGNGIANKNLRFFTGGYALTNERFRITGTGNIGINNTNPTEKLDITGNLRFSGALMPNNSAGTAGYVLVSSGAGVAPSWQDATGYVNTTAWVQGGNTFTAMKNFGTLSNHDIPFLTNSIERMRLTATGLGIGTTNPTEKLQVDGNLRLSGVDRGIFFDATMDPYAGIKTVTRANEVTELMLFSGNDIAGTYGADRIRLASQEIHFATSNSNSAGNTGDVSSYYANTTNAPTQMLINENGNVAIGTTTFDASAPEKLLVDGGTTTNYNLIVGKGDINNYLQLNIQNENNGNAASSDIVATANNGSESTVYIDMGINSQGYATGAGILNGSNTAYLYATGNNFFIGNGAQNKDLIFFTNTGATGANGTEKMRITPGGTVSINSSTPNTAYKLYVNGSAYTTGTWQASDRRLKTNIGSLKYGLKDIMTLQPVRYNWIDPNVGKGDQLGFIAQDVRKIIPEIVNGDEQKETLSVNYTELVPILVNAIKEQQQQIEELNKRIKALENK